jgi:hypothetical protein
MRDILIRGREEFGVVSVKAEFEAEGTRMDELLRLIDIARSAGLPLTVKIGGCEAIRDLLEAKQIGVKYIVAPMVETAYALRKYVDAKNLVFSKEESEDTDFLFNMETITGFNNRDDILSEANGPSGVDGIVFGRVDFSGSMKLSREVINQPVITEKILTVAQMCQTNNLDLVVGGGVSIDTIEVLRQIAEIKLSRFETRKVVFSGQSATNSRLEDGLLNAVHFELLWLTNKRDYYSSITKEDKNRIDMLEARWQVLNKDIK